MDTLFQTFRNMRISVKALIAPSMLLILMLVIGFVASHNLNSIDH